MTHSSAHSSPRRPRPALVWGAGGALGVGLIAAAAIGVASDSSSPSPATPSSVAIGPDAGTATTDGSAAAPSARPATAGSSSSQANLDGAEGTAAGDSTAATSADTSTSDVPIATTQATGDVAPADEQDDSVGLSEEFVVDVVGAITQSEPDAPGDPMPVPLEPVEGGAPEWAALLPGRSIVAHPSPLVLGPGVMNGAITIVNCGSEATGFTPSGPDFVGWGGSPELLPGEAYDLGLQIDDGSFGAGAIEFEIVITESGGQQLPVDVYAWKPNMADVMPQVADVPLSGGLELTGCGNQCIVEALISRSATSADVTLSVQTHTAAALQVFLRPEPQPGDPITAITTAPFVANDTLVTEWSTSLTPLLADRAYLISVVATDADGHVSVREGRFLTGTPHTDPDFVGTDGPVGCAVQCFTHADVTVDDHSMASLSIETHTPAEMAVFYAPNPVLWNGDVPFIQHAEGLHSGADLRTSWNPTIDGLDGDTTYHVVIRAQDAQGRASYETGSFTTPEAPPREVTVTFEKLLIDYPGDRALFGELEFEWGINDDLLGSSSRAKVHAGTLDLGEEATTFTIEFDDDTEHLFTVNGGDWDALGRNHLCQAEVPGETSLWRTSRYCKRTKWNPAPAAFSLEDIGQMDFCGTYDVGDDKFADRCVVFSTPDRGPDYPRFRVYLSFHFEPYG